MCFGNLKGEAPAAFENKPARVPSHLLDENQKMRSLVPKASSERKRKSKSIRRVRASEDGVDEGNRVDNVTGIEQESPVQRENGEVQL